MHDNIYKCTYIVLGKTPKDSYIATCNPIVLPTCDVNNVGIIKQCVEKTKLKQLHNTIVDILIIACNIKTFNYFTKVKLNI